MDKPVFEAIIAERDRLVSEVAEISASLEQKREQVSAINKLISLYSGTDPSTSEKANHASYTDMRLSKAVMTFLRSRPNDFFKPSEIGRELLANGYQTVSPNLNLMIRSYCLRKSEAVGAPIVREERGGVGVFRARTEFDF